MSALPLGEGAGEGGEIDAAPGATDVIGDLGGIRRRLEAPSTVGELLAHGSEEARRSCGFARAVILSVEDGRLTAGVMGALVDPASDAIRRRVLAEPVQVPPGSLEREIIRRGRTIDRPGGASRESVLQQLLELERFVLSPVLAGSRVVALLVLDRNEPPVSPTELTGVEVFSHLLGTVLERLVLLTRMRELAKELRHLTTSAQALMQEAAEAPIELPADLGHGAVFTLPRVGSRTPESFEGLLTKREREILELLAAGRSTREVAEQLVVSPETVKSGVARMLRKLDATNRVELVARYVRMVRPD